MTSQSSEICRLGGVDYEMLSDPLADYYDQLAVWPVVSPDVFSTACRRGYIGHWQIRYGQLYLRRLITPCGKQLAKVGRLFPDKDYPIKATWFTGQLRLQVGEILFGWYAGWARVHEGERILHVRKGEVVRERRVDTRQLWKKLSERDWNIPPEVMADVTSGKATLGFYTRGPARTFFIRHDQEP